MKRIVALLMITLILVGALVSCGTIPSDPADLKAELEEMGADVKISYEKSKFKYYAEKAGVSVDNIKCLVSCELGDEGNFIFCMDSDTADRAEEYFSLQYADKEDIVVAREGKVVYAGSKVCWELYNN